MNFTRSGPHQDSKPGDIVVRFVDEGLSVNRLLSNIWNQQSTNGVLMDSVLANPIHALTKTQVVDVEKQMKRTDGFSFDVMLFKDHLVGLAVSERFLS